jgi:hypothetical protein
VPLIAAVFNVHAGLSFTVRDADAVLVPGGTCTGSAPQVCTYNPTQKVASNSSGSTWPHLFVTVQNVTGSLITLGTISGGAGMAIVSNGCGTSLAPSANCVVEVKYGAGGTCFSNGSSTLTVPEVVPTFTTELQFNFVAGTWLDPTLTVSPTNVFTGGTSSLGVSLRNDSDQAVSTGAFSLAAPVGTSFTGGGLSVCGGSVAVTSGSINASALSASPAGGTCTFSVPLATSTSGTKAYSLPTGAVTHTTCATPIASQKASLANLNVDSLTFSPAPTLDLGSQNVGSSTAGTNVTVTNPAPGAFQVTGISASGDFSAVALSNGAIPPCSTGFFLAGGGGQCNVRVTFTPTAGGVRSGSFTLSSSTAGASFVYALQGTGTVSPPAATFSPASPLTFSDVLVGSVAAQTVTLTNTGAAGSTLTTSSFSLMGGVAGEFAVVGSGAAPCVFGGATPSQLAQGQSCGFRVTFTPGVPAGTHGPVTFSINDTPASTAYSMTFSGTVQAIRASAGLISGNAMVHVGVGGGSVLQEAERVETLTLTTGSAAVIINALVVSSGEYVASGETGCQPGQTMAANSTCTVTVRTRLAGLGTRTATLTIDTNENDPLINLSVNGIPALETGANPITGARQRLGVPVTTAEMLRNNGTSSMKVVSMGVQNAAAFALTNNTCTGATLAPGGSCTYDLTFTPPGPTPATFSTGNAIVVEAQVETSPSVFLAAGTGNVNNNREGTAWPDVAVAFIPNTVARSADAQFQVRITNAARVAMTNITYSTPLPSGLVFSPTLNLVTTNCPGIMVSANPGSESFSFNSLSIDSTATVAPPCEISANVRSQTAGMYPFSALAGEVMPAAPYIANIDPSAQATLTVTNGAAVTLGPASQAFGKWPVGSTSSTRSLTLSNGDASLSARIDAISLCAGGQFQLASVAGACANVFPFTLAPGAGCSINVNYTPGVAGAASCTVQVDGSFGSGPALASSFTGEGVIVPTVSLSLSAGSVNVNVPSTLTVGLGNDSNAGLSGAAFTLALPAGVIVNGLPSTTCGGSAAIAGNALQLTGATIPSGGCQVQVSVKSASVGVYAFSLAGSAVSHVFGTGNGAQSASATLNVTAAPTPSLGVLPTSLDFGNVTLGQASGTQTITVTSNGSALLSISAVVSSAASEWEIVSNTCLAGPLPGTPPGNTCNVVVRFTPAALSTRTGAITFTHNAPVAGSTTVVALTGSGSAAPAGALSVSPSALAFGSIETGDTSAQQTLLVSNTGSAALTISSLATSNAIEWVIVSTTCQGATLIPMATCNVLLRFEPQAVGARSGSLTLTHNAPMAGSVTSVTLTGTGLTPSVPGVSVSPLRLEFGNVAVGQASASQTLTLTNTGRTAASISGYVLSAAEFAVTASTCGAASGGGSITASGGSCTLTLVLTPSAAGVRSATLSVNFAGGLAALAVPMEGTGVAATSSVTGSPASLDFGTVELSGGGASLTLTLTNTGSLPVTLGSAVPSPTTDFTLAGGTCTLAAAVVLAANGGTCTLVVTFVPQSVGTRSGMLDIAFVDQRAPALRVPLTGTGAQARLAVTKTFDPATIVDGAESTLKLRVTNLSARALTAVTLVDAYPAGLTNAADGPVLSNPCNLALDAVAGSSRFAIASGNLDANQACDLTVKVRGASGLTTLPATGVALVNRIDLATVGAQLATNGRAGDAQADATRSTPEATLTLTSAPRPVIQVTPTSLPAFADTPVSLTSAAQNVTIGNAGNATLSLTGISLGGSHASDFTLQSSCPMTLAPAATFTLTLAPAATCTLTLAFRPTTTGTRTATLVVSSNDPTTPTLNRPLSGNGIPFAAVVDLQPVSLAFADQIVDTTSAAKSARLTNRGNKPLAIASIDGRGLGDFAQSNNCGANVSPGAGCDFTFTFRPLAIGERIGELLIVDDASGSPRRILLSGRGVEAPRPILRVDVGRLDFAPAVVGTQGQILSVVVANTGNAPLTLLRGFALGRNFTVVVDSCSTSGTLSPGGQCLIQIRFTPQEVGALSDVLRISTFETPPWSVALTGTGQPAPAPQLRVSPERLSFADQVVNTESAALEVRVSNPGTAALTIESVLLTGAQPGEFQLADGCGVSLAAGADCVLRLTFRPSAVGARQAILRVRGSVQENGTQDVVLAGIGIPVPAPRLELSATQIAFGNRLLGGAAPSVALVARNTGGLALVLTNVTAFGDFSAGSDCTNRSIAPSASCTLPVGFFPTTLGERRGEIQISSNAEGAPTRVTLTGTGCAPFTILGYRLAVLSCAP